MKYHAEHFEPRELDDKWLPIVGEAGWFVVGQDYRYHTRPTELFAIRTYNVGCFYVWGSQAPQWDVMRVFAKAYDRICDIAATKPRPFFYAVHANGAVREMSLDSQRVPFTRSRRNLN